MATTKGSVPKEVIEKFLEKHPLPDGQKRYPKGSKEDAAFLEMYRGQCENEIHTNRGNTYKNTKDSDRLDQHARWHLGKVVERLNNPKPARAPRATTGETAATATQAEEHATKQTGGARKKAHRKAGRAA